MEMTHGLIGICPSMVIFCKMATEQLVFCIGTRGCETSDDITT
jgi:hypothetical protein